MGRGGMRCALAVALLGLSLAVGAAPAERARAAGPAGGGPRAAQGGAHRGALPAGLAGALRRALGRRALGQRALEDPTGASSPTTWSQQAELTAGDGAPGDYTGRSVAVS